MSMRTVIVLSALSDTSLPRRAWGEPGPCSRGGVPSPVVVFFARSCSRRRRRATAFCRRTSRRSSGVDAGRRRGFARAATRRSCGVIGGAAGSAGAAGAAGSAGAAGGPGSGAGRPGRPPPYPAGGARLGLAPRSLGLSAGGRHGGGLLGRDRARVSRRRGLDGRLLGGRRLL